MASDVAFPDPSAAAAPMTSLVRSASSFPAMSHCRDGSPKRPWPAADQEAALSGEPRAGLVERASGPIEAPIGIKKIGHTGAGRAYQLRHGLGENCG